MPPPGILHRLTSGSLWTLIGAVASRGGILVALIFAARVLGREDFGRLGIAFATFTFLQSLAGHAPSQALTRYVALYRAGNSSGTLESVRSVKQGAFAWSLLLAIVTALAASSTAAALGDQESAAAIAVAGPAAALGAWAMRASAVLIGAKEFRANALANVTGGLLAPAACAIGATTYGPSGAIAGIGVAAATQASLASVIGRRILPKIHLGPPSTPDSEIEPVRSFLIPTFVAGLIFAGSNWACVALLTARAGVNETAVFVAASQWFNALFFVPTLVGSVSMPMLAESWPGRPDRAAEIMRTATRVNVLVTVAPAVLVALASPLIARAYGESFAGTATVFAACALTVVPLSLFYPMHRFLYATGHAWRAAIADTAYSVGFLAATAIAVKWLALGVAVGRAAAFLVQGVVDFRMYGTVVHRRTKYPPTTTSGAIR